MIVAILRTACGAERAVMMPHDNETIRVPIVDGREMFGWSRLTDRFIPPVNVDTREFQRYQTIHEGTGNLYRVVEYREHYVHVDPRMPDFEVLRVNSDGTHQPMRLVRAELHPGTILGHPNRIVLTVI